jgi:hypothetical protein
MNCTVIWMVEHLSIMQTVYVGQWTSSEKLITNYGLAWPNLEAAFRIIPKIPFAGGSSDTTVVNIIL